MNKNINMESIFFSVLDDLKDYLSDLTLVGGWMPYVYSKFLWRNMPAQPITTVDIDFGFGDNVKKKYKKSIFEVLRKKNYSERHLKIGKLYPIVLYKDGKVPIDFISTENIKDIIVESLVGCQIVINKVENFCFLINNRISIQVKKHKIYCPKPAAFLFHKALTFTARHEAYKKSKDLFYMYFVLRYAPDKNGLYDEINQYKKEKSFKGIKNKLHKYFSKKSSEGCIMVERENGPDEYIEDLRKDIFKRFAEFVDVLS